MLKSLAYSPREHETARLTLAEAEEELELARKAVSEKKVQMGILKADLDRLTEETKRKKELERTAVQVGRRAGGRGHHPDACQRVHGPGFDKSEERDRKDCR